MKIYTYHVPLCSSAAALRRGIPFLFCLCCSITVVHAFDYGIAPNPLLELDDTGAGQSSVHRLSFDVYSGELETYRAIIDYPDDFRFQGFDALGPRNTPIGYYALDFDFDGVSDTEVALRSLTLSDAYADVLADREFSPGLEPVLQVTGDTQFVLTLPYGGDANPTTLLMPFDAGVVLSLFAGVLTNPPDAGFYTVNGELVSVDPDTDDHDDGAGTASLRFPVALSVVIDGPADLPFAAFHIEQAQLKVSKKANSDSFSIRGRYTLGAGSNGIDPLTEEMRIAFGPFSQTIPSGAFTRTGNSYLFTSRLPGIEHLRLRADGRFQVIARRLDLSGIALDQPVSFSLQIGDERGETELRVDRHGGLTP